MATSFKDLRTLIGQTISHYRILAKIGEDATGTLYKAADREADLTVTIKTLSPEAAANPLIRTRLERASRLQHPNIARIYELSRLGGIEFVVMEAAEGESAYDFLERERPHRRHLLRYATQIAGALSAAHDAGIVHGPLNPAAIFISPKQHLKIHDFGFGVLDPPPQSEEARQALFGASAPYVSPEQIQGKPPDIRSDIFSFGALLYTMTTGQSAFRAAALAETWKAILENEPKPISQITSRAPRGMDKLLERCLRKNPQRRFQQIAEIQPLLEKMARAYFDNPDHKASFLSRNRATIARIAVIALAAAATVAGTVFWWQTGSPHDQAIGGRIRQITSGSGFDTDPTLSADGSRLAYASDRKNEGNLDIWVQPAEGGEPLQLTNDPADDREPAFSADGATIAFRSDRNGGGIYLIPSKGGEARLIAPEGRRPRFSPDGRWIAYWVGAPGFAPKSDGAYKVFVIPSGGGSPRRIRPDFASCTNPIWSPDSRSLLFSGRPDSARMSLDATDWFVASVDGDQVINTTACLLFHRESILPEPQYGVPGEWKGKHIYFSAPALEGSNIWRADIDADTYKVSTKPVRVTSGAGIEMLPSAASAGRMVFVRQFLNADIWGIPLSANDGKVTGSPKRWTSNPGVDVGPSLSSDGSRLLFQSNRTGHHNLWTLDTASGKESPVTASPEDQLWPVISPDGSKVAWSEQRIRGFEQLYKPIDGGSTEILCETCGQAVSGWSKDSRMMLVNSFQGVRRRLGVSLIKLGSQVRTTILQDPNADLRHARFSPDDRSIAFLARMDGGSSRIYVAPFRDRLVPSSEWIALTDGSAWESSPQWSPDGKLVYYGSTRDGYHCVWAQHLDAANRPAAAPFAVYHLHTARRSTAVLPFDDTDLFVGRNQLLLSLSELTGNIWSAKISE
jgi:Tol biopolymer transport system component